MAHVKKHTFFLTSVSEKGCGTVVGFFIIGTFKLSEGPIRIFSFKG